MASKSIIDPDEFKTPPKMLALVGALLILVGVFLPWMSLDFIDDDGEDDTLNWNSFQLESGTEYDNGTYKEDVKLENFDIDTAYPPIVVLIFAILCLMAAIISSRFGPLEKFYPFLVIILGLLVLILVFLQFNSLNDGVSDANDIFDEADIDWKFSFGFGLYMGLIGGLLVLVGGALPIIQDKLG